MNVDLPVELTKALEESARLDAELSEAIARLTKAIYQMVDRREQTYVTISAALAFIERHQPANVKKRKEQASVVAKLAEQLERLRAP